MIAQKNKSNLAILPCTALKGVGPLIAEKLAKCNIFSVQDLLFHLPFRYQDRTHVSPIGDLRAGDYAVIQGTIEHIEDYHRRRPTLVIRLRDGTGLINLRFFHYSAVQKNALSLGACLRCVGEVRMGYRGLEIVHPEYRRLTDNEIIPVEETLTPIYPTTEGLHQRSLRSLTEQALNLLNAGNFLEEYLPETILHERDMPSLCDAIQFVHRPPPDAALTQLEAGIHPAQQRLAFEELLAHHLSLRRLRMQSKQLQAPKLSGEHSLTQRFLSGLSFELTKAQERVVAEIGDDLIQEQPMLRLVQGDVGSGKTVVAALAIIQAVTAGYQAVLMAPTDLLSEQHATNFRQWLDALNIKITVLAGKHKGKLRENILAEIASGTAKVIIGTHALFQEGVHFNKLALIVIDEQHRFGVHQRLALREKGSQEGVYPHQLIMTATPIPRTLAMTVYADLDISIIDELPPGRTPVKTVVIPNDKRLQVVERVRQACLEHRQAYWVCTLIEESELLQCQAAEATKEQLIILLGELRIGLVHGRLKAVEKEAIMRQFKANELDLLVATTVIEVGVDVPNASLMVIENAERLGLAQLHQLRGRVGRGATESYCVLLYQAPLSQHAQTRLKVMRATTDGFEIAKQDLEIRGPGEMLGTKQTGLLRFRIADLRRDQVLLKGIPVIADDLLRSHETNALALIQRWLGSGERYGGV
jgi:ATP-dependent DNA helicase RecG